MKCIYCGEETDNDSVFCEHCGKKLVDVAPDNHQYGRDTGVDFFVYLVIGALLIVGIIMLCVS